MASQDYPAKLNLTCTTNQTFKKTITWTVNSSPVNLTGAVAAMDIKWDGSNVSALTLSTTNGRIVLGGSAGTIAMTIPYATMATMTVGVYDYDLVVTLSGEKTPLIKGTFTVTQGTTTS